MSVRFQRPRSIALEIVDQLRRIGIATNTHDEMHVVGHHGDREQFPSPIGRGLSELLGDDGGLVGGQQHGFTDEILQRSLTDTLVVGIDRSSGDVVSYLRPDTVRDVADEASPIAWEPAAVCRPGEKPVTVHGMSSAMASGGVNPLE
jgi:hypothetical protein